MKKVLFCLQTMVLGGVEAELITILKRFDRSKYDISLLILYDQDSEMTRRIPDWVKVINLDIDRQYYCSGLSTLVKKRIKKGELISAAKLCFCRAFGISPTGANVDINKIPSLNIEYDVAICYHLHSPVMLRYVADKVKAKRKLAWIHNDFSTTHYEIEKYGKWLDSYDKVAAVSQRLYDELIERCPQMKSKSLVVHNIVDEQAIREKSQCVEDLDERFAKDTGFKLLTVGRFVEQKGYDIAVEASRILRDRNIDFTWYIIGYGDAEKSIRALIDQYGLEDRFIILGRMSNPYPYMATCDLYVQPSRHEGYPITLCEALALDKTVLCTDFAGAKELVEGEGDGVVVGSFEPSNIANEIERYILAPERLKKNVTDGKISRNEIGWNKIESLFIEECNE